MSRRRVAILISGTGSNMVALLAAMAEGRIPAEPALVLSNRPDAAGLARAEAAGVPTAALDHRAYPDRASFDAEMQRRLDDAGAELVACAGFMRIMTDDFVNTWRGRMVNIHPSLLPLFKGVHTHAQALAAGVAVHGATVHEVVPELDSGPILGQAVVPVRAGDTPDTLAARVLAMEHRLYPAVLAAFVADPEAARRVPMALFQEAEAAKRTVTGIERAHVLSCFGKHGDGFLASVVLPDMSDADFRELTGYRSDDPDNFSGEFPVDDAMACKIGQKYKVALMLDQYDYFVALRAAR